MNRDQVKGKFKDSAGKLQRKIGEATGSGKQQVKGATKQVEGKVQKGIGNMREDAENRDRK